MSKANVSQQKPVRAGFRPQCYIAKHKAWASKGLFYIEQRANLTPIDNLTKLKAVEDLVASAVEVVSKKSTRSPQFADRAVESAICTLYFLVARCGTYIS